MKRLGRVAAAVGGALFVALFLTFLVQIAARFGWQRPLAWTDELAVILYVWVILWAAAFMVPEHEHVVFDLLWNRASPRGRRLMRLAGHLLMGGLALVAIPASWDYVAFMAREGTPVLGIPFMWVFLPLVTLLIALVLRSVIVIADLVRGRDDQTSSRGAGS